MPSESRLALLRSLSLVFAALIGLAVPAATAAVAVAQEFEPKTTLPDIEDEVMCPVCGTTLELASDSPQAIDQRDQIRDLIGQGLSKEEIKDELVAEFGPEVIAEPSKEGFDLAAWLVPGLAVLIAAVVAFIAVRRWRGNSLPLSETNSPHTTQESAADSARLDEDLKRYEL